ncbi:phytoalexin-deficient 4-2 protein [Trifolium medium]|uniref:Phytoalexin-deficient 4-2 protein n=1 Tax=Trifolium medium TaxID=97028 RepID=A0A392LXK1_9FABA|nr:phytoalexin-deficient 4-2 protein [Trifolium medium]
MELFLRSQDNNMWSVIEVGEYTPPPAKDSTTPKPQEDWTIQESDRVLLNTKAKLFIKSALNREEHDRIMECKTAKEMWYTLQNHHEGSSRVKETRIDIGVRRFELFEMKEDETIDQMYGRLTVIINELNSLGKRYTPHERVRKILRSLPKSWRHIVTAITEAKDLKELKLEDLIGSLRVHESILQEDKPKKLMIALESQTKECSQNIENLCDEKSLQEDDEEEFAFISRRIQRLMIRRNQMKNSFQGKRNNLKTEVDLNKIQCYGCNQFGHYKNDCPKTKQGRNSYQKKSFLTTWNDLDEPLEKEEQQEANMCLMTHSNQGEECLLATKKKSWYLDSGCSRHMTRDRQNFLSFEEKEGGSVTFGNNEQASIKGKGIIGKVNSAKIENVHYVEGLKHNLISIGQLCDDGLKVIFKPNTCEIRKSGKVLFNGSKRKNVYVLYLDELPAESCFISLEKDK